jgi:hypothetical protein
MNNLAKILRIKREVSPKSYFEELADSDLLFDYVQKYYPKRIKTDTEFRDEIYDLIAIKAGTDSPFSIKYKLERMVESFSFFLEYTKEWTIQNNLEMK